MYLNKDSLKLDIFEYWDESFSSLPLQEIKYGKFLQSFNLLPTPVKPLCLKMEEILHKEKLSSNKYKLLIDYKVRELKSGSCGCMLEGWHLDVVENPNHKSNPDLHAIYSTEVGTNFVIFPMEVYPSDRHFKHVLERYENTNVSFVRSKQNNIHMYNRFQLHSGPKIEKDCRRMVLRLTLTEVIK